MTSIDQRSTPTYVWQKLGRVIQPRTDVPWMVSHTGAAAAVQRGDSSWFDVYLTGRDAKNRSRIGRIVIDIDRPLEIEHVSPQPVLALGQRGTFDENGTSYPCIVQVGKQTWMYYTGWMPTVLTPFQNQLGLALQQPDGTFRRVSRAPIMDRTNDDPFSIGAVCVVREELLWRMWYTAFDRWGSEPGEPKHTYFIKYAESDDGIRWRRENRIAIPTRGSHEHSISRPTINYFDGCYHMWFCYRGDKYRIGYAHSSDGVNWVRDDAKAGITCSESGWDSAELCYPHVFRYQSDWYLMYCGNDYGNAGLGIARLQRVEG